jgi:hypothetical protein
VALQTLASHWPSTTHTSRLGRWIDWYQTSGTAGSSTLALTRLFLSRDIKGEVHGKQAERNHSDEARRDYDRCREPGQFHGA